MIPLQRGAIVLCDANVLYGNFLRDLIMWLGVSKLIAPRWTAAIQQEWITNPLAHRPDLSLERLERTQALMARAVPEAILVEIPSTWEVDLPDPDDLHVLRTAHSCGANYLMTFNLKDFPTAVLPAGLTVIHPDDFLCELWHGFQAEFSPVLRSMREAKRRPSMSEAEFYFALERAGLPKFAARMQE